MFRREFEGKVDTSVRLVICGQVICEEMPAGIVPSAPPTCGREDQVGEK